MVKKCSHGGCKSDSRYPHLIPGVEFVPFVKPKTDLEKCLRWIKYCGRPHDQLNIDLMYQKSAKNRYICTKHFVNRSPPNDEFPDPLPADPYTPKPSRKRKPPTTREDQTPTPKRRKPFGLEQSDEQSKFHSTGCQTTEKFTEALDVLTLAVDNQRLVTENQKLQEEVSKKTIEIESHLREIKEMKSSNGQKGLAVDTLIFSLESVIQKRTTLKYYTGFDKDMFNNIYTFFVPQEGICPLEYCGKINSNISQKLTLKNQFFMTLCRLRHNFDLQDLATRFSITKQAAGVIFSSWINYMFLRSGEVGIWPHRDIIKENMPPEYSKDFPDTIALIDCTELKTERPSSLKAQSQFYSDYKAGNTVKALIAVDPRGSLMFSSVLYTGGISDKEMFNKCGFGETLQNLIQIGYISKGDGLMVDKGFNIESQVDKLGLRLNIPPFAKAGKQMTHGEALTTTKIAKHRVHVERAIRRIKTFKIVSGRIQLSLLAHINHIWYVCSFLTLFMPPCIKY